MHEHIVRVSKRMKMQKKKKKKKKKNESSRRAPVIAASTMVGTRVKSNFVMHVTMQDSAKSRVSRRTPFVPEPGIEPGAFRSSV